MKVKIAVERSIVVPLPYPKLAPLLKDPATTIGRLPKLRNVTKLGNNAYLLEMRTMGSRIANIAYDVAFGARFHSDAERGELSWEPILGQGNARISGYLRIASNAKSDTDLSFGVSGELHDVPVPLLYRMVAPPFIQGKFTSVVDIFLEQTREALVSGKAFRPEKKKAG